VVLLQYMTLVQWLVPQVNTDLKHWNSNNGQISQGFVDHTYCFFIHFFIQNKETKSRFRTIGLFVLAMFGIRTYPLSRISVHTYYYRKIGFDIDSFFLSVADFQRVLASVGYKTLLQGIVLWLLISSMALWVVISFF
jgi:hypothetical protein